MDDIAEAISRTERRAMVAERSANERYMSAHMASQIGDTFSARISGVSRAGLFVALIDTGAEGLIPISRLGEERFFADDSNMFMTGGTTGLTFRIGQTVEVELVEATPIQGGLLFALLEGGTIREFLQLRQNPRVKPMGMSMSTVQIVLIQNPGLNPFHEYLRF